MADSKSKEEHRLVARPIATSCGRLHRCCAQKGHQVECIRALIRRGAYVEEVNEIGLTPLLAATRAGNTAAIAVLLDAGADINSYGHTMWTALHFAAHLGDSATIEALVTRGGDLTARTTLKGKYPLHIAAGHAETRAVQDLVLRWGADETLLDSGGRSASDIAGDLKNVFDRGHDYAERVKRIRVMLANAPRDRRWMRRRTVVMVVSRLRGEIARERSRQEESNAAKKRGGGVDGTLEAIAAAAAAFPPPPPPPPPPQVKEALGGIRNNSSSSATAVESSRDTSALPRGMAAVRDTVIRLAGEENVDIFRNVVGFL